MKVRAVEAGYFHVFHDPEDPKTAEFEVPDDTVFPGSAEKPGWFVPVDPSYLAKVKFGGHPKQAPEMPDSVALVTAINLLVDELRAARGLAPVLAKGIPAEVPAPSKPSGKIVAKPVLQVDKATDPENPNPALSELKVP